jgi:hypothetical protein
VTGRPDLISDPSCDGTAATANFEAVPAAPDPTFLKMMNRDVVKQFGKGRKSRTRLSTAVSQQVIAVCRSWLAISNRSHAASSDALRH